MLQLMLRAFLQLWPVLYKQFLFIFLCFFLLYALMQRVFVYNNLAANSNKNSLGVSCVNTHTESKQQLRQTYLLSIHGYCLSSDDFLLQLEPAVASVRVCVTFPSRHACYSVSFGTWEKLHSITKTWSNPLIHIRTLS